MRILKTLSAVILAAAIAAAASAPAHPRMTGTVDVNRASAEEFARIPGIDLPLARALVRERQRRNYFTRIEDILDAEGMTRQIFEQAKEYLVITDPAALRADEIIEEYEILAEEEEDYFLELDVDISRLEAYRSSPLDLNTAVYSQLLELPGIDSARAHAVIALRREMRGFDSVDDIRELLGPYVFERVLPFVAVLDEVDLARLHGDVRVSAAVDQPYHPYYFDIDEEYHYPLHIEARHRLRYGNRIEFGFQMRRKASAHWPPDYGGARKIDYANFSDYFLGTRYLLARGIGPLDTVVLGSYRLDYFRPATRTRRLRGLREDDRAAINAGFYGAAAEMRPGSWELTAFVSEKEFAVKRINEYDGSVGDHPRTFYYTGNYPMFQPPYLKETIYGGIVRRPAAHGLTLGVGGYTKSFDRIIDPAADFRRFRGDRIDIIDLEAEYEFRNYRFIADLGYCRYHTFDAVYDEDGVRVWEEERDWRWDSGTALRLTMVSQHGRGSFWAYYWRVEHDYFDLLGEGYDPTYNARNQERYSVGGRIDPRRDMYTQLDITYLRHLEHLDTRIRVYEGGRYTSTRYIYENRDLWSARLRQSWDVTPKFLLRYTGTFRDSDEWRSAAVAYTPLRDISHRLEVIHRASDRIRLRGVIRTRREVFEETGYIYNWDQMHGESVSGNYGELRYRPTGPLVILARISVQEDGHGIGWSIRPVFTFSRHAKLRVEYEYEPRSDGGSKNIYGIQYDMSW